MRCIRLMLAGAYLLANPQTAFLALDAIGFEKREAEVSFTCHCDSAGEREAKCGCCSKNRENLDHSTGCSLGAVGTSASAPAACIIQASCSCAGGTDHYSYIHGQRYTPHLTAAAIPFPGLLPFPGMLPAASENSPYSIFPDPPEKIPIC